MNNEKRRGRFTSSGIYKLIPEGDFHGFQKPAITYIKEKQIEVRMQSCLDVGAYSQPMAWGNFMEYVIFNLLGLEYKISSKETDLHPDNYLSKFWSGSNDLKTKDNILRLVETQENYKRNRENVVEHEIINVVDVKVENYRTLLELKELNDIR